VIHTARDRRGRMRDAARERPAEQSVATENVAAPVPPVATGWCTSPPSTSRRSRGAYSEEDEPNPVGSYGLTQAGE